MCSGVGDQRRHAVWRRTMCDVNQIGRHVLNVLRSEIDSKGNKVCLYLMKGHAVEKRMAEAT